MNPEHFCAVCGRRPTRRRPLADWRPIRFMGKALLVCSAHYPDGNASASEFARAHRLVMVKLASVYFPQYPKRGYR